VDAPAVRLSGVGNGLRANPYRSGRQGLTGPLRQPVRRRPPPPCRRPPPQPCAHRPQVLESGGADGAEAAWLQASTPNPGTAPRASSPMSMGEADAPRATRKASRHAGSTPMPPGRGAPPRGASGTPALSLEPFGQECMGRIPSVTGFAPSAAQRVATAPDPRTRTVPRSVSSSDTNRGHPDANRGHARPPSASRYRGSRLLPTPRSCRFARHHAVATAAAAAFS
jgi:hypothetical protein